MTTTIEVFTFSIRKKRAREPLSFSDEPDFFEMLIDEHNGWIPFIDKNITGDLPAEKMTMRLTKEFNNLSRKQRYLCGIIETGHYGKEYEVVDKDDPEDEDKKIFLGKSKAILKPFFYFIKIPRTGDKALLILERTENDGIFPVFRSIMISYINEKLNKGLDEKIDYTIDRNNVVIKSYLKKFTEGHLKSYTLTVNKVSSDVAERYCGTLDREDFSIDLIVRFNNNLSKDKENTIRDLINSGEALFESSDLNAIFEGAEKKYTSTVGGGKSAKTRTFYMNEDKMGLIRPYYDVEVEENDKGFSDYKSIKEAVKEFVNTTPDFRVFD